MNKWSDYQSPTKNYSPRRPDSGARFAVIAVLAMLLVIGACLLWG